MSLLLIGGIGSLGLAAAAHWHRMAGAGAAGLAGLREDQVILALGAGTGLLLLAGLVGLMALRRIARDYRGLARAIQQIVQAASADGAAASLGDLQPLAREMHDLADAARRAVEESELRVREMQIQLKVADAQRQHAQAILYSISDAVLVTDPYDELVLANESAARTFDFELAGATRRHIARVLADPKLVGLIQEMRQSHSRNGRRIVEHRMGDEAQARTFKVTLSCVSDHSDQPAGVVAVLHDMTREKEIAQMKNDFVSSVSHELRTPLASIKAYVEMLIDGEAEDEDARREFYEVISNEANRLSRLIDNILNISRIESGLVKITKQPLSLTVVTKEAIEVIAPQARLRNIRVDDQLAAVFYQTLADKDMIYQAVLNLLSNAVKYTPEGGVVTVQTAVDETTRKVSLRISDTGVGIPPKDLPFVFDKFYRSEANNRMAKGTGLGLSLVRHIVETVHRGRVFVESKVGQGSTFGFELELCE